MPREFDWAAVVDYARRQPAEAPRTQYELPGVTEVHFIGCGPSSQHFEKKRLEIDGVDHSGATARRAHRSMPLAEML